MEELEVLQFRAVRLVAWLELSSASARSVGFQSMVVVSSMIVILITTSLVGGLL